MAANEKHAAAKTEYIKRRAKGKKINLREFAGEIGVRYDTLRRWKAKENWDAEQPRKRGGQPGNKNAKGNPGGGAPLGNKNAEKDGAYSAVFLDNLTDDEKRIAEMTPDDSRENLRHELKVLRVREKRILDKIAQYEQEQDETLHLSSLMDMREPEGSEDGATQTMGMYSSDTAFTRTMKLNEALYKVQGRIVAVINAMHSIEEAADRKELDRERLEIMKMRATGIVEIGGEDEGDETLYE